MGFVDIPCLMSETVFYPDNYRRYFIESFENRSLRNPSYSMRAFARDLGLGTSTLSEILQGKYGLSKSKVEIVVKALQLSEKQGEHFLDLVVRDHSRSLKERDEASQRVQERIKGSMQTMTLDSFRTISEWYHLALLELLILPEFKNETGWMARKLNIPEITVHEALERMERLGMIERKGKKILPTDDFSAIGNETPSELIRKFHRQVLEKAIVALDEQTVSERESSSTIFAISKADLPKAKKKLVQFRREFATLLSKSPDKDDVYCLGIQFFSLLKKEH